jgi:oligopeptide transport system permease protein
MASMMRNLIIVYSNREYNIASRTLGSSSFAIILNNILPYLLSIIVTTITAYIPSVVSLEITLTYFGFGFVTTPSLGKALQVGYQSNFLYKPHIITFPAVVIAILTGTLYFIGVKLADATDPRTHR